jgi:phosphoesterase RecJ-like protein
VADLLRIGVNPSKIHKQIYDNNNLSRLRFLGFVLKDKLVVDNELHTAIISISKEEIAEYQVDTGDTEGVVNYALSVKGIVLGVVVIERKDMVKLSFRSVGNFDVNTFARQYFEGGGHKNASGGKSEKSINDTVEYLMQSIKQNKNNLAEAYDSYFKTL